MPSLDIAIRAQKAKQGADQFDASTRKIRRGARDVDQNIKRTDTSLNNFGRTAKRAATGLIGLAAAWRGLRFAGSSLKAFADFETSLARVSTMLDDQTAHFLPEYEKQIAALAIRYGQTTKTLAKGTFDIISGSFEAADAMEFLETATRSAIGGFTDVATSVKAMVAILNAYGMSAEEAGRVTDVMSAIVKKGVIEYEELAGSIGQVVPIAAAAGLSLEELAAAIATITQKGVSARMTMTALKAIITTFLAPTPEAIKLAKEFGLELSATTLSTIGLTGALAKLQDATSEETAAIFSNVRALLGVEATRKTITKLIENHETAINSLGLSESNYQKVAETTNQLLAQNRELWISIKREIGEDLAPTVNEFLKSLQAIAKGTSDAFSDVREGMMETIVLAKIINELGVAGAALQGPEGISRLANARLKAFKKLQAAQKEDIDALSRAVAAVDEYTAELNGNTKASKDNAIVIKELAKVTSKYTEDEQKLLDELAFEREIMGLTNDVRERAIALRKLQTAADKEGVEVTKGFIEEYKEELKLTQQRRKEAEATEEFNRAIEEGVRGVIRSPLAALLDESKDIEDALKESLANLATNVLEFMYEETITDPLMKSIKNGIQPAMEDIAKQIQSLLSPVVDAAMDFGGMLAKAAISAVFGGSGGAATGAGSITGSGISGISLPAAKGAVFNDARLTPFARGGVLNGPTVFPMANGGLALGGEAGDEALMPLSRDSKGRLGVAASSESESNKTPIKIINVMDMSQVQEYLGTGDGERQVVNIMRRNAGEIAEITS